MGTGYAKIYESILTSSIWEEDYGTRIVWISLLAMSDADGFVNTSIPGLARMANVSREECEKAIETLESPDPHSKSPEHEGRRIEVVHGGIVILNHAKHRKGDKNSAGAKRTKAWRDRQKEKEASQKTCDASQTSRDEDETGGDERDGHNCHVASASASASGEGVQGERFDPPHNATPTDSALSSDVGVPCPAEPLPLEVIEDMADKLGVTVAAVREGLREFKSFWTVGGGTGRTKTIGKWRRDAREDIRRKHEQGKLVEPKQGTVAPGGSVLTP